jgi:hypothetical protein
VAEHGLRVLITHDQQVVSDVEVHATSLVIGSGGHCDVRLGPDLFAIEQLRLSIDEGQVWAEALAMRPQVTLGGRPFSSGSVTPSDALSVGPLFIQVAAWHEQVAKKGGHKRFIVVGLLLAALAFVALSAAVSRKATVVNRLPEAPASPFAEADVKSMPACPERAQASAVVAAGDMWREAIDSRERSPFSPKNGLEAVRMFNTSASCFEVAGDKDSADEAHTQASMLRAQLEKSFHVHRVRLDHSISQKDFLLSRVEVNILKSFLAGRDHPYAVWLDNMDRWLEVTQGTRQLR